jgi:hypothetical protein
MWLNKLHPNMPLDDRTCECFKAFNENDLRMSSRELIMDALLPSIYGNLLLALDDKHIEGLVHDTMAEIGKAVNDQLTEGDFKRPIYSSLDCRVSLCLCRSSFRFSTTRTPRDGDPE